MVQVSISGDTWLSAMIGGLWAVDGYNVDWECFQSVKYNNRFIQGVTSFIHLVYLIGVFVNGHSSYSPLDWGKTTRNTSWIIALSIYTKEFITWTNDTEAFHWNEQKNCWDLCCWGSGVDEKKVWEGFMAIIICMLFLHIMYKHHMF